MCTLQVVQSPFGPLFFSLCVLLVTFSTLKRSQVSCEPKIHPLETHQLYSKDEISPSGVEVCECWVWFKADLPTFWFSLFGNHFWYRPPKVVTLLFLGPTEASESSACASWLRCPSSGLCVRPLRCAGDHCGWFRNPFRTT